MATTAILTLIVCVTGLVPLALFLSGYTGLANVIIYVVAAQAGAVPLCLAIKRPKDYVPYVYAAVALFFALVYVAKPTSFYPIGGAAVVALGSVAIFRLAIASFRETPVSRTLARHSLMAIFSVGAAVTVSRVALFMVSRSVTLSYDRFLYACDASFGGQISFAAGRLFSSQPALRQFCLLVYYSLPFALLFLFAHLKGTNRYRWMLLAHFALIGIAGRYCYLLVPAMGPLYEFPGLFPGNPPSVGPIVIESVRAPNSIYNAMPSLHTAWALMLGWWTRGQSRWLQIAAAFFVFFTLLATLGLGEHYLIDLVVAVPFSVATFAVIAALLPGHRIPWMAFGVSAGLTASWLVLLRSVPDLLTTAPLAVPLLCALTLALSLWVMPSPRSPGPAWQGSPSNDSARDC